MFKDKLRELQLQVRTIRLLERYFIDNFIECQSFTDSFAKRAKLPHNTDDMYLNTSEYALNGYSYILFGIKNKDEYHAFEAMSGAPDYNSFKIVLEQSGLIDYCVEEFESR